MHSDLLMLLICSQKCSYMIFYVPIRSYLYMVSCVLRCACMFLYILLFLSWNYKRRSRNTTSHACFETCAHACHEPSSKDIQAIYFRQSRGTQRYHGHLQYKLGASSCWCRFCFISNGFQSSGCIRCWPIWSFFPFHHSFWFYVFFGFFFVIVLYSFLNSVVICSSRGEAPVGSSRYGGVP